MSSSFLPCALVFLPCLVRLLFFLLNKLGYFLSFIMHYSFSASEPWFSNRFPFHVSSLPLSPPPLSPSLILPSPLVSASLFSCPPHNTPQRSQWFLSLAFRHTLASHRHTLTRTGALSPLFLAHTHTALFLFLCSTSASHTHLLSHTLHTENCLAFLLSMLSVRFDMHQVCLLSFFSLSLPRSPAGLER